MPANQKRLTYRMLSLARMFLAFGIGALFLFAYLSPLQKWSDLRVVLMSTQFTGALTRGGLFCVVILSVLSVTAFAGRWYCSVLCPFGTLQEFFWRAGRMAAVKTRFISPWRLRYIVPVIAGIGIVAMRPFMLMDPISNFGR